MKISKLVNLVFVIAFMLSACSQNIIEPNVSDAIGESESTAQSNTPSPEPENITGNQPNPTYTPSQTPSQADIRATLDPKLNTDAVFPNQKINISFSEPVNMLIDEPALLFYPHVEGEIQWNTQHTQLTFHSPNGFEGETRYQLSLHSALQTKTGELIKNAPMWEINTLPRPKVLSNRSDSKTISNLEPRFTLHFSQPMNQQSVESNIEVTPKIDLDFTWKDDGQELLIKPVSPLSPGTSYQFLLNQAALSLDQINLTDDETWQYTSMPYDYYISMQTNKSITINFNFSMPPDAEPFQLEPAISGTWKWTTNRFLTFTANQPFEQYENLQYRLIPTEDLLFLPQDALKELKFNSEPIISKTTPENGVQIDAEEIIIQFKIAVDQKSVEEAFLIEPMIPGKFLWNGNSLTYQFLEQPLNFQEYTITIQNTITNLEGKPALLEPYQFSFKYYQWEYDAAVTFAEAGPNLQVVDSNGKRSTQFVVNVKGTPIFYKAYKLEFDEFLQRYSTDFGDLISYYYGERDRIHISTDGLETYFSWQEEFESTGYKDLIFPTQLENGFYILTAQALGSETSDSIFIVLTENTLVVKKEMEGLWVWASDINGQTKPNMEIRLYSDRGEKIRSVDMGEDGTAKLTIPEGYNPMLVGAFDENGVISISGLSYGWKTLTEKNEIYKNLFLAHLYTDRPIYQPGQTLFYKGIIRRNLDTSLTMSDLDKIKVEILDPKENMIETQTLSINQFGSFYSEYQIPEGVTTGYYTILLRNEGEVIQSETILIENYIKPETKLNLSAELEQYISGDKARISLQADYMMGFPVDSAKVTITTYEINDYALYYYYDPYSHSEQTSTNNFLSWNKLSSYHTKTNQNGYLEFEFPVEDLPSYDYYYYSRYRPSHSKTMGIEACIEISNYRDNCTTTTVEVFPSSEIMEVNMPYFWVKGLGETLNFTVKIHTLDNKPVVGRSVEVAVESWSSSQKNENKSYSFITDEEGIAHIDFKTADYPGYFEMSIISEDPAGRERSFNKYFYVGNYTPTFSQYYDQVEIQVPEENYKAYDRMPVYIRSTFSGPAMLTFERGTVIHAIPIELTAPLTIYETTVIPEFAPNVTIKINAYQWQDTISPQNDEYYFEYTVPDSILQTDVTRITVPVEGKKLILNIKPDQENYQPGQGASFSIHVEDESGNPVRAELSASLVDEALFQLRSDESSIFNDFYGERSSIVTTHNSMDLRRLLFYYGRGGGGGEQTSEFSNNRSDFKDAVYWNPSILTDKNGDAEVKLTLPDNLTTWRLTVKANSTMQKFGQEHFSFETTKPYMIQPQAIPTMIKNDQMDLSATVFNNSSIRQTMYVRLVNPEQRVTITNSFQELTLEPGQNQLVYWPVAAKQSGNAKLLFSIEVKNSIVDSVELPLNIKSDQMMTKINDQFSDSATYHSTFITQNAEIESLSLKLWKSPIVEFSMATNYLIQYPYGCVEQTLSRILPNTIMTHLIQNQMLELNMSEEELGKIIQKGLARLYSQQHADGSWGWWYDSSDDYYFTALAVYALALTQQNGYYVEEKVLDNATKWMLNHQDTKEDPALLAFGYYTLTTAGETIPEDQRSFIEEIDPNDTFSMAVTALSLWNSGDQKSALELTNKIKAQATIKEEKISWPQETEEYIYRRRMDTQTRSLAMVLSLLIKTDPNSELIPLMVNTLRQELKGGYWENTNTTSFVLLSLGNYLSETSLPGEADQYLVKINGQTITTIDLAEGNQLSTFSIPLTAYKSGIHFIEVSSLNDQKFYLNLTQTFPMDPQNLINPPIQITRKYVDNQGNPLETIEMGQIVRVELDIRLPEKVPYLMIKDPLPSGFIPLNERLNNTGHNPYQGEEIFTWNDFTYSEKQIEKDHVLFFVTSPANNQFTLTYLVQVQNSGTFTALPAEVSSMYDDLYWGSSEIDTLTVQPYAAAKLSEEVQQKINDDVEKGRIIP